MRKNDQLQAASISLPPPFSLSPLRSNHTFRLTSPNYVGYNPSFQWANLIPKVVGWSIPTDLDNGFIAPSAFSISDIICHKVATPGQDTTAITAGSSLILEWTSWPSSHHEPGIDYLAPCNGPCALVDKTALRWFKIDGVGLLSGSNPGNWETDTLIANSNTWSVKIPADMAPGEYVLRHEIIVLHAAGQADGAQDYPQCVNLNIKGSGTKKPAGVALVGSYTPTDPGILYNLYTSF
ncbi:hypothetical protein VC83_08532 [Pseudogymnoascus destructans]|uniref:Auxiliary Activity family 9 catalytic domain-containing protein n=2 Tax=Pseudogymnoascus destructans TaxID=655981 RepID=L8FMB6_PSED2|nr:uncharacterized protein VC83_08532 [Pseudogymnoascus destructans]ELR02062.1 hypothetical protein GMDG_05223 [Pseudogymnoascus destructans 20631-21]OAF54980.1 hypothetical protein VC83_08532 [Pseudogymnoascus destructans]